MESDTILGRKKKDKPSVFTIVERTTGCRLSIRTSGKTTDGVAEVIKQMELQSREWFPEIFRIITIGNGSEFAAFSELEPLG